MLPSPPARPRAARAILWTGALTAAAGAVVCAGCHPNDPVYFPADAILQTDGTATEVTETVALRFRSPSASEQADLDKSSADLGYAAPWLRQDRIHLELRYTVTNLGDRDGTFSLFVDGATEFTRFDYQAVVAAFATGNEKAPPVGLIQISNPPFLAPGQVFQGTVREDDFREGSLDLDAMGRFMAPFVSVLINRSEVNPVGLEMVPSNLTPPKPWILPALWEITPRFTSTQPMTLQFLVRVRDDDQRLWEDGAAELTHDACAAQSAQDRCLSTFTPVVPPKT